ncbi:hypothetical protein [Neobacillus niacini]|uniref:hypothetical protein n=1 Tax=Neobacillus niacini TaxID=86668 RepID=UPI0021CB8F0F|nr:hypothetical protein [Neobacillus niacini]MCM3764194.1 hypothetical protein [Neobacillus niacini]
MKKVLAILFSAAVFLGIASPAFAAEDDYQKGIELIEKTNKEIDKKIEEAVGKADRLQADYLLDIRKIEEGDKIVKLKGEKEKALSDLEVAKNDIKKQNELHKKLAEINAKLDEQQAKINSKITEINQEIDKITGQLLSGDGKDVQKLEEKINKLNQNLDEKSAKSEEKTKRFTKELDKVITGVFEETLIMSNETIKKAAKKGVQAECSWQLVRFADKWVWIDPIRIVGC